MQLHEQFHLVIVIQMRFIYLQLFKCVLNTYFPLCLLMHVSYCSCTYIIITPSTSIPYTKCTQVLRALHKIKVLPSDAVVMAIGNAVWTSELSPVESKKVTL